MKRKMASWVRLAEFFCVLLVNAAASHPDGSASVIAEVRADAETVIAGGRARRGACDELTADPSTLRRAYGRFQDFIDCEQIDVSSLDTDAETQTVVSQWNAFKENYDNRLRLMTAAEKLLASRKANADRTSCLRQDELDLVVPSHKSYILRTAIGGEGSTDSDVYLTAEGIKINELSLKLKITRVFNADSLDFDIGDRVFALHSRVPNSLKKAIIVGKEGTDRWLLRYDEYDDAGTKVVLGHEELLKTTAQLRPLAKAFNVEILGDSTLGKETGLAVVDFDIITLKPLFRSSVMSLALSALTNRDTLEEAQHGKLQFKLYSRAIGKLNHATGMWEVELLKKEIKPFSIELTNQGLVNRALAFFGSKVETLVVDAIWAQLDKIIPKSFAALTSELSAKDLQINILAHIRGRQESRGGALILTVDVDQTIKQNPRALLDALVAKFDVKELVQRYATALVKEQDLKTMWSVNKDAVAAMLHRYGVDTSWIGEDFDEVALKEKLYESVQKSADFLIMALKPFMTAREKGSDPFAGIAATFNAGIGWNVSGEREGRMLVELGTSSGVTDGLPNDLQIPKNFFDAIGAVCGGNYKDMIRQPKENQPPATFEIGDLKYEAAKLSVGALRVSDMRIASPSTYTDATGPISTKQVWKMSGGLRNIDFRIPQAWDQPWKATLPRILAEYTGNGVLRAGMDAPLTLEQLPIKVSPGPEEETDLVPLNPRKGSHDELTGPVPDGFKQPMWTVPPMALTKMAPEVQATLGITMSSPINPDGGSTLVLTVRGTATVSVNITEIIRQVGGARPTVDSGYIFFAGASAGNFSLDFDKTTTTSPENKVQNEGGRFEKKGGKQVPRIVKVVVNCGYLRLIQVANYVKENNEIVNFADSNFATLDGQYQVDLGTLTDAPSIETKGGKRCMSLGRRKWSQRSVLLVLYEYTEIPMLCAEDEAANAELEKLRAAVEKQVTRFQKKPAETTELNFGTHRRYNDASIEQAQFRLPAGMGTGDLSCILKLHPCQNSQ